MNKPNLKVIWKGITAGVSKHKPEILTGLGIAGFGTAIFFAVKGTVKATRLVDAKKEELGVEKLTAKETIETAWKCYIPTAIMAATSTACLIGASSVSARRISALTTAYKLSETALTEYREKVVETIGEKKEQVVREKIAKDHVDKNPVSKSEVIVTGNGSTLCMDIISGRYFTSDIDKIKRAQNNLNEQLLKYDYVSLNDFYDEIGLPPIEPLGSDMGWNIVNGQLEFEYSSQLDDKGNPCLVIGHQRGPKYGYSDYT